MAITKGAKKAHKQSLTKRLFNDRRKREMKRTMKQVRELISSKDKEGAEKMLPDTYKAIDKAAKRGVIKKNNAARKKSRLVAAIKKISVK